MEKGISNLKRIKYQRFWNLIEEVAHKNIKDVHQINKEITNILVNCTVKEINDFDIIGARYIADLHEHLDFLRGLQKAGYTFTDDGLSYFAGWLIVQGLDTFKRVVEHPGALLDLTEKGVLPENEGFAYCADDAYEIKRGLQLEKKKDFEDEDKFLMLLNEELYLVRRYLNKEEEDM